MNKNSARLHMFYYMTPHATVHVTLKLLYSTIYLYMLLDYTSAFKKNIVYL